MMNKKLGFTMAEALSVLILLGVVAAITIPTTVNRMTLSQNRTKIKKALETYDSAVRLMASENRITNKARLDRLMSENNCSRVYNYFKAVEQDGCIFRTADGIWWDVGSSADKRTSISNTLIAFKRADLTKAKGYSETTNDAFYFHTEFDDRGALRIQDTQYSNFIGDVSCILDCAKTYGFIDKKKMYNYYKVCQGKLDDRKSCMAFDPTTSKSGKYIQVFYNNNGDRTTIRYSCKNTQGDGCGSSNMEKVDLGSGYALGGDCDTRGICTEGNYYMTHSMSPKPSNLSGEQTYNNIKYTYIAAREVKRQCKSTSTDFSTCTGLLNYDAVYKNGNDGLYIQYSDSARTKITRVSFYNDSNGYWNTSKTVYCDDGGEYNTIKACLGSRN